MVRHTNHQDSVIGTKHTYIPKTFLQGLCCTENNSNNLKVMPYPGWTTPPKLIYNVCSTFILSATSLSSLPSASSALGCFLLRTFFPLWKPQFGHHFYFSVTLFLATTASKMMHHIQFQAVSASLKKKIWKSKTVHRTHSFLFFLCSFTTAVLSASKENTK